MNDDYQIDYNGGTLVSEGIDYGDDLGGDMVIEGEDGQLYVVEGEGGEAGGGFGSGVLDVLDAIGPKSDLLMHIYAGAKSFAKGGGETILFELRSMTSAMDVKRKLQAAGIECWGLRTSAPAGGGFDTPEFAIDVHPKDANRAVVIIRGMT